MDYRPVSRITISLPPALIEQLDTLAKTDYAKRSTVIRLALLEYLRNRQTADDFAQPTETVIEKMHHEFPGTPPNDIELLQFMTYYKYNKEQ